MKRRLSSQIRSAKFLFLLIGLGLVYVLINSLIEETANQESMIVMVLVVILCGTLYYLFDQAKTVEFDHEFMYVTGKTGEETVPLKDVYKIKLTMTKINNRSMWKIGYYDQWGAEKSVRILPRWLHKEFDEFKRLVQGANKDVKIQNWSHSFDLDQ